MAAHTSTEVAGHDTALDAETAFAHQLVDEQESYRTYQAAEHDILDVLETEELDDATRKRRLMRVFDRFRYEYAQLSTLMREQIRAQRKIMDKVGASGCGSEGAD